MYQNMNPQQTAWSKISRNASLIATISLINHTMSIVYSMMTFQEQSGGFISIIVASLVCFFLSSSHLTIYGISILGILYLKMLQPYYSRSELHYIVAVSGIIVFPFWKAVCFVGKLFDSLPCRVHACLIIGIVLISLIKFFPLSIENINALLISANSSALTDPLPILVAIFHHFSLTTLFLTLLCIGGLLFLRQKLPRFPLVAILTVLGVILNYKPFFINYGDLCQLPQTDCLFYIVKIENIIPPSIQKLFLLIPSASVLTCILLFQQFLYLQQFERRGKRYFGEGDLGQTTQQSKALALSNIVSGLLGGLPICINLLATYENFSFNIKSGRRGTKLVGLVQIPINYLFYTVLKSIYQRVPLFILFVVVGAPAVYFIGGVIKIHLHYRDFIIRLAALNVLTHPIIALMMATFFSIHDLSLMLKDNPSQILLQNIQEEGSRRSVIVSITSKKEINDNNETTTFSEFIKRIISTDTDQPEQYQHRPHILYRFTGIISYLNYFGYAEQIKNVVNQYSKNGKVPILLSFRYASFIDEQSLAQLALLIAKLEIESSVRVLLTGLHSKLLSSMERVQFFQSMLKKDQKCMYRID